MKTIRVKASRPYDVLIGHGLLSSLGYALLERHARCSVALLSDETVFALYGAQTVRALEAAGFTVFTCLIPSGEATKGLRTVDGVLIRLAEYGMTKDDVIVALGGGVTGDIAGFAASIFLRGIAYVQIPTTLFAALESSVGGKTGVSLPQGRNLVGAFWQPFLVLCDCSLFDSLPHEVFLDGVAESLKYGMVCDKGLFEAVAQGKLDEDCTDIVARCVEIKARFVTEDERDQGKRQLLQLGYTLGGAIEQLSGHKVPHGHALSVGIVGTARVAEALGVCVMGCAGVVMAIMDRLGLPCETSLDTDALAETAMADKRRQGSVLSIVLPESIGQCVMYPIKVEAIPQLFRLAKGGRR